MNPKILLFLGFALSLLSCGKEEKKTEVTGPVTEAVAPSRDFKSISGITASVEAQNVCPYEELDGSYKIGSSECSHNGKKAEVDYLLVPTRYVISTISESRGSVEVQFTRDGSELLPFALDFPRVQTSANAKKLGVQCGSDATNGNLTLLHACVGASTEGGCFYSIVKKDNKLMAITSQVRKGVQYWCKSSLRKVEASPEE